MRLSPFVRRCFEPVTVLAPPRDVSVSIMASDVECSDVAGMPAALYGSPFSGSKEVVSAPAGERNSSVDQMSPGAAISKQHTRHIERPAPADVAARSGRPWAGIQSPKQAEHRFGSRVGDDQARHVRRKQGGEGLVTRIESRPERAAGFGEGGGPRPPRPQHMANVRP